MSLDQVDGGDYLVSQICIQVHHETNNILGRVKILAINETQLIIGVGVIYAASLTFLFAAEVPMPTLSHQRFETSAAKNSKCAT